MTQYSDAYLKAVELTLGHEGGFSNHPADPGGETNFGITKVNWESWCRALGKPVTSVRDITHQDALSFYKERFWDAIKGDRLPEAVAIELFDTAVNCGPVRAVTCLQNAINFLVKDKRECVKVDGDLGPATIGAAWRCVETMGIRPIIIAMNGEQYMHYRQLVWTNPDRFRNFSRGWTKRLAQYFGE